MSALKKKNWTSLDEIIVAYSHNPIQQKSEVLDWVRHMKLPLEIAPFGTEYQVKIQGFLLETFRTLAAAKYYVKRIHT